MRTLITVALVCLAAVLHAQDETTSWGVKAGLNVAMLSTSVNSEASSKLGFHIGGYVRTALTEKIFFRPELYFSSQGQKEEYQPSGSSTVTMNYLNIPVLLEFGRKVSFQVGPQLGLLLSAKEEGSFGNHDIKDALKGADVSAVFGVGFAASEHIGLGARLNLGLSDIVDDAASGYPATKHRVFHFYIAYAF